jgi:hypothetical protein
VDSSDPTLRDDLHRRAAEGITPEMSAASRRRFALLQAALLVALAIDLVAVLSAGAAPVRSLASTAALAVVLGATIWRYRRFSPRSGQVLANDDVAALLPRSFRCSRCHTVVLPEESECPRCGSLRNPKWALVFGVLFGVSMTVLALWRAGMFAG